MLPCFVRIHGHLCLRCIIESQKIRFKLAVLYFGDFGREMHQTCWQIVVYISSSITIHLNLIISVLAQILDWKKTE